MAKFTFRLQKFFELKQKLEDQKEIEYAQAVKTLNIERQKLAELQEEQENCLSDFRKRINERIDPVSFQMYNYYLDIIKKKISTQQIAVQKALEFTKQKQSELVKAMQERKAIEILRDNAYAGYLEEEKKQEQRINDEIVTYRFAEKIKTKTNEN